jgi:transcriptional regulator with XRE-family HTH domain
MAKKRQYASISELVHETAPDSEFGVAFDQRTARRKVIKGLLAMRAARGLSQQDIAEKLECTQSRISKLENSCDDDMRLGDLRAYAQAIGCELVVGPVPQNLRPVDKVKCHVLAIKKHTDDLANLARTDEQIAGGVARFFFELVVNFGRLAGDSVKLLPNGPNDVPYFDFNVHVAVDDCPEQSDRNSLCCLETDRLLEPTL